MNVKVNLLKIEGVRFRWRLQVKYEYNINLKIKLNPSKFGFFNWKELNLL